MRTPSRWLRDASTIAFIQRALQVIYNRRLEYLLWSRCLQDFVKRHHAVARICDSRDRYSILLIRDPYVVELSEISIDNYVEIWLSDMNSSLWVSSSDARSMCRELELPVALICQRDDFLAEEAFISFHSEKANSFPEDLSSIDAMLTFIVSRGGMHSVAHIAPPPPFNERPYVRPMASSQMQIYQRLSSAN